MDKYNLSELDFIEKLILIEKHLGRCNGLFYNPTPLFNSFDSIQIQKEASNMLKFVGLENYTAVITYSKTKQDIGGNIELDNSQNVFIYINYEYKGDNNKVLAILAHEICHKVLYVRHLYYPNITIENELLTDLTTVYIGFGRLSLNGCYSKITSTNKEIRDGKEYSIKTTQTNTIGYLSLNQFALAYNILYSLGYLNVQDKFFGLNDIAKKAVFSNIFSYEKPISYGNIKQTLKHIQKSEANLTNSIKVVETIIEKLKNDIKSKHLQYNNELVIPFKNTDEDSLVDNQLKAALALLKQHNSNCYDENDIANSYLIKLIDNFSNNKEIDYSCLLYVECPCCGYKSNKKLSENKTTFVKCPKCGYYFVWDGEKKKLNSNNDNSSNDKNDNTTKLKNKNYFDKIKMNIQNAYSIYGAKAIISFVVLVFVIPIFLLVSILLSIGIIR